MIASRVFVGRGPTFSYLIWNLALAWIPLVFSYAAYRCYGQRDRRNFLFLFCAVTWFLFFPNAPYITTDIIHLRDDHVSGSWFHLLTTMAYAWTGLCLGFVSLYLMQEIVRARLGRAVEWFFVLGMLGACSFGIYIGRYLRWNSWDILRHPIDYLRITYHEHFASHQSGEWTFTVLIFLFLLLTYVILYTLTHLHEPSTPGARLQP